MQYMLISDFVWIFPFPSDKIDRQQATAKICNHELKESNPRHQRAETQSIGIPAVSECHARYLQVAESWDGELFLSI